MPPQYSPQPLEMPHPSHYPIRRPDFKCDSRRVRQYDWPGNVRELQHVIERAIITSTGSRLNIELPSQPTKAARLSAVVTADAIMRTDAQFRQIEAENIRAALKAANGKVSGPGGAAELLGIKPTTLASRLKSLKLNPTTIESLDHS